MHTFTSQRNFKINQLRNSGKNIFGDFCGDHVALQQFRNKHVLIFVTYFML